MDITLPFSHLSRPVSFIDDTGSSCGPLRSTLMATIFHVHFHTCICRTIELMKKNPEFYNNRFSDFRNLKKNIQILPFVLKHTVKLIYVHEK